VRKKRSALFVKLEVLYAENNLATGVTLFAEFMRRRRSMVGLTLPDSISFAILLSLRGQKRVVTVLNLTRALKYRARESNIGVISD
jgi:hypothetical protein